MNAAPSRVLALVLCLAGCRAADVQRPGEPAPVAGAVSPPPAPAAVARAEAARGGAEPVLVGLYCPTMAAGRPGVAPLFLRDAAWDSDADAAQSALASRAARQLSVLGWDGRRVGIFSVAGLTQVDGAAVAIGAYAGSPPCAQPGEHGPGPADPACMAALSGCGLAVAPLEPAGGYGARPFEEDPDPADVVLGAACVAGGELAADVDGDREPERFPAAALGRLAEEVGARGDGATCEAAYAGAGLPGGAVVLAVADLDADGRREIIVRRGDEWAIYAAPDLPTRLERGAQTRRALPR